MLVVGTCGCCMLSINAIIHECKTCKFENGMIMCCPCVCTINTCAIYGGIIATVCAPFCAPCYFDYIYGLTTSEQSTQITENPQRTSSNWFTDTKNCISYIWFGDPSIISDDNLDIHKSENHSMNFNLSNSFCLDIFCYKYD